MIESRCGLLCSQCGYREQTGCTGCVSMKRPFWAEHCPVKDCCETRKLEHCGQCAEFPCQLLSSFAYDKDQGDDGKRLEQCKCWVQREKKAE